MNKDLRGIVKKSFLILGLLLLCNPALTSAHDVYMGVFTTPTFDPNIVNWQGKNFASEKTYIDVTTGTSSLTYTLLETIWLKGRVPEFVATFTRLKSPPCDKTLVDINANLSITGSEDYIGMANIAQGIKNWLVLGQYRFTLLTFIHEPNWSNCYNGSDDWEYADPNSFKSAFIKAKGIVDGVLGVDAERVQWVFNPNNTSNDGMPGFESYYPGNDYVDWVGLSAYNWGGYTISGDGWSYTFPWQMFNDFKATFDRVGTFAERKPLMLAEYASVSLDTSRSKDEWVKDFLQKSTQYAGLCLLQYFNLNTPGEGFSTCNPSPGFDFPVYWDLTYDARHCGYNVYYPYPPGIRQQGWLDAINNSSYMNSLKFSPCTIAGVCTNNVNINNFDLFPELRNREFDTVCGVPPCSYSINPVSKSFASSGGSSSISVTTQSGCKWTATEELNWVTIDSGSSGKDDGTVNYTVLFNPTGSTRTGNMTVAGETLGITQDPANVYNFVNGYTNPSQVASGGTYIIGCDYGQALDCIYAVAGQPGSQCSYLGFSGTTAQFQCTAGTQTGVFNNTCGLFSGSPNNCAERSGDPAGSLTQQTYTIQTSAGTGGSISPAGVAQANYNQTYNFTINTESGYSIRSVTGCGGSLNGSTYTTGPITADCTVSATFNPFFEGGTTKPSSVKEGGHYLISCDYGKRMDCIYPVPGQSGSSCMFTGFAGTAAQFFCTAGSGTGTFNNACGLFSGTSDNCPARNIGDPASSITVEAAPSKRTIQTDAGAGGSIAPAGPIEVNAGFTYDFTITPDSGYKISTASGCGGSLSGNTYSTGPVTSDCTVSATFIQLASNSFVGGATTPSQVNAGGSYKISCDYGSRLDCIRVTAGSGSCMFTGFTGTAAQFFCIAGSELDTFDNFCGLFSGTSDNCSAQSGDPAGSVTVQ